MKKDKEIGGDKRKISNYIHDSGHPTSKKLLTLAWCRFTVFKDEKNVVLDEIQTDLQNPEFKLEQFMKGWENVMMRHFIDYIRHKIRIRKIYMPTYRTKQDRYNSSPPMRLYKELPFKFGFSKKSNLEGFLMLEKKVN